MYRTVRVCDRLRGIQFLIFRFSFFLGGGQGRFDSDLDFS